MPIVRTHISKLSTRLRDDGEYLFVVSGDNTVPYHSAHIPRGSHKVHAHTVVRNYLRWHTSLWKTP